MKDTAGLPLSVSPMHFDLKEAIKIANQAVLAKLGRNLTDVEILVLQGAWNREEYDQVAAKHQYATSYISQDVAPKLWKALTDALGERVRKSNFKEALKRYYEQQSSTETHRAEQGAEQSFDKRIAQLHTMANQSSQSQLNRVGDRYVERPPLESLCYETLLQPGALIRIKAPILMGKTLLMNRVLAQLVAQDYRTVHLSFELADRKIHFTNLDRFLRWLCINLSRELGLPNQVEDYWDEAGMGSKVSCTTYVEDYLLAESDRPFVLCLDDVDLIFAYPEVYEDVFGLLRSWYEKARSRPSWKKLRLAIVHSTDVYIQLNLHQSPFNVGLPLELPELTFEQSIALAHQHGWSAKPEWIVSLMNLVGGHPYLLEQAFSYLKLHPAVTISQFLAEAATEAGIYAHHLREHWLTLQQQPELSLALKSVLMSTQPIQLEPMKLYQLQRMGLVKLSGNQVTPRCHLYRQYFQAHLGG